MSIAERLHLSRTLDDLEMELNDSTLTRVLHDNPEFAAAVYFDVIGRGDTLAPSWMSIIQSTMDESSREYLLAALDYRRKELEAQLEAIYRPQYGVEWKQEAVEELTDYEAAYAAVRSSLESERIAS